MKKFTTGILALLFVFVLLLTGCKKDSSYEETTIETAVIQCEEGTYHPNASYLATANMYLAQQKVSMWSMYMSLANANGSYDYNITISIDGSDYVIVRSEQYEIGQTIIVTKVDTYKDSQLVKTEYK